MFSMPSQDTFGKVRLKEKVESRVRGNLSARFGGECLETYRVKTRKGAGCLAYGQIASAKIPLSRMISPQLYWVMTGDDFTLDLNNPEHPKILCVGNNPDRQNIYSAALGLYNSRIVKLVNKKGQLKSSIIIDELPTIYFRGIDNLIATARSNKVAVCLGFQDFSQLARDYGDKEAKVIQNTVGNIFSGQVVGETAKNLSERFGKILQQRQSLSINRQDTSTSINTQMDSLIPASKIANLSQGTFVGSVADNFGEEIEQKIFHARIIVDTEKVAAETKAYKKIPVINEFKDSEGNDIMQQQIERNYTRIKADVVQIIEDEMERIANGSEPQAPASAGGRKAREAVTVIPIYYIIVAECVGRHVPLFFFYAFITSTSKKQMHYFFSTCKGSPAPRRIVQGRGPVGVC